MRGGVARGGGRRLRYNTRGGKVGSVLISWDKGQVVGGDKKPPGPEKYAPLGVSLRLSLRKGGRQGLNIAVILCKEKEEAGELETRANLSGDG